MADTKIRTVQGQFTSDTSTFDLTVSGESRTPTGAVVIVTEATALDTETAHASFSWGATDFTDVGQMNFNDEDAQGTADSARAHQETDIIRVMTPGTSTVVRSATIAAVTGGIIRFTPGESGTQFRVQAIIIFGSVCKFFSSNGDGNLLIDEEFIIAHGMTTEPGAGFYGFNLRNTNNAGSGFIGLGFHAYDGTIEQASCCWAFDNGEATTSNNARATGTATPRCVESTNNSGAANDALELTAIDTTNVTYTNRVSGSVHKYMGLLVECDDIKTKCEFIDSPTTAASDWNYSGTSFKPQFAAMVMNRIASFDTNEADADAGVGSFCAIDEDGSEHSAAFSSENGADTSNCGSEMATTMFCPTELGADSHLMANPTFNSTGWKVTAANITAADGTIRRWPVLVFEQVAGGAFLPYFPHIENTLLRM